jgi:hypothetical protein
LTLSWFFFRPFNQECTENLIEKSFFLVFGFSPSDPQCPLWFHIFPFVFHETFDSTPGERKYGVRTAAGLQQRDKSCSIEF